MSRRNASRLRQLLLQTEESRQRFIEDVLGAGPLVLGSLVTLGRKCGKPNCRCATGEKHQSKFLSRSEGGRTRMVYVPAGDELAIAARAGSYRRVREARAALMKLAARTAELIDELVVELSEQYPPSDRATKRGKRSHNDASGTKTTG